MARRSDRPTGRRLFPLVAAAVATVTPCAPAAAQTVQELQQQIDELKAVVRQLQAQRTAAGDVPAGTSPVTQSAEAATVPPPTAAEPKAATAAAPTPPWARPEERAPPVALASGGPAIRSKPWYERLRLRGYTQMRVNEIISGDKTAPEGISRVRSMHDGGISDKGNFTFRRIRLVLEGNISDDFALYLQPDFAQRVNGQSVGEPRDSFAQIRDAYVDWFIDPEHRFRLRFGQSKVPFGWENLQSSSNRITLDRSDGVNSAVPSERELGVVAYYTPAPVQKIWDRLAADGQKLFGNFGAFGVGVFNGQGVNRRETNDNLMMVAMATWPLELDGLGGGFEGQVLELGGSAMRNRIQPELRSGGVSATSFVDDRVGLHAVLYPKPIGFMAEWTWGRAPEFDPILRAIRSQSASGGYFQTMFRVTESPVGRFMPYARWQRYRGGWKAVVNSPRLETNEVELGIEFQPAPPIELTVAYAHMKRREADERRMGRAEGSLIRTQLQWNY